MWYQSRVSGHVLLVGGRGCDIVVSERWGRDNTYTHKRNIIADVIFTRVKMFFFLFPKTILLGYLDTYELIKIKLV